MGWRSCFCSKRLFFVWMYWMSSATHFHFCPNFFLMIPDKPLQSSISGDIKNPILETRIAQLVPLRIRQPLLHVHKKLGIFLLTAVEMHFATCATSAGASMSKTSIHLEVRRFCVADTQLATAGHREPSPPRLNAHLVLEKFHGR